MVTSLTVLSQASGQPVVCDVDEVTGALTGTVRDASGAMVLPGVQVVAQWEGGRAEVTTGADGTYQLCELPANARLMAFARFAGFSSAVLEFQVPSGQVAGHDFLITLSEGPRQTDELGRIIGSVIDADTEGPVEAALVGVAGRAHQTFTDSAGQFVLENVPAGELELELRHLAYGMHRAPLSVESGASVLVIVKVAAQPIEVEPIQVTVTAVRHLGLEIRGFYERREWGEKLGRGYFFTAEDIERRRPRLITHMIADLPSTRLDCSGSPRRRECELRFVSNPVTIGCQRANVYINSVRVIKSDQDPHPEAGPHSLDQMVLPSEIAGVEVYPGAASLPAEFTGASGSCGAIVIWTK